MRVRRFATAILIALLFLVPIVYVIVISLESSGQFLAHPLVPLVPPSVGNFGSAWQQGNLGPEVVNTIIYSISAAAISTALSLLIAFPVARRLIRWASPVFAVVRDRALPALTHHPPLYRVTLPTPLRQPDRVHLAARGAGSALRRDPADRLYLFYSDRTGTRPPGWTGPVTPSISLLS